MKKEKTIDYMAYYFSKTDEIPIVDQKKRTTSADSTGEIKTYEFNKPVIKFTDIASIDERAVSEETEENFYKKAFETKSLKPETIKRQILQEKGEEVVKILEEMNNFEQAKADGKEEWNRALEQSSQKVRAAISIIKRIMERV